MSSSEMIRRCEGGRTRRRLFPRRVFFGGRAGCSELEFETDRSRKVVGAPKPKFEPLLL
jgi:hypothetical protein